VNGSETPTTAVVATAFGGPEVLAVIETPVRPPGAGEVLIKVRAAGTNPIDYKLYSGAFGQDPSAIRDQPRLRHRASAARTRPPALPTPLTTAKRALTEQLSPLALSWSGGKDSALALWTLREQGLEPRALITTITETYDRASMHGVRRVLIERQADALGLPLVKVMIPAACPNEVYEARTAEAFSTTPLHGVREVAFGDLFLEDIRAYREQRLAELGLQAVFPLWHSDTSQLALAFINQGHNAVIVCVDPRARRQLRRPRLRRTASRRSPRGRRSLRRERRVPHLRPRRPHVRFADRVQPRRRRRAGRLRLLRPAAGVSDDGRPLRICSLLPSATEIVGALGLADWLVAVSEECDWPPQVGELPVVTASRVDTSDLSSLGIEEAVRDAVRDGRPPYAIDRDLLDELAPDLILTQNLCAVCAVSADTVGQLCATDAELIALDAHTLQEIEGCILSLAERLGVADRGEEVVERMEKTIARVRRQVAGAPTRRVFLAEWLDPPYAAGHWIPEMVALAGGHEVLGQAGAPSYPTSWEAVIAQRPELVVVAPCGFDHQRAAREAALPPLSPARQSPSTPTLITPAPDRASQTASPSSPSSSTPTVPTTQSSPASTSPVAPARPCPTSGSSSHRDTAPACGVPDWPDPNREAGQTGS
jgi:iron complex transport system substrate-binding protein